MNSTNFIRRNHLKSNCIVESRVKRKKPTHSNTNSNNHKKVESGRADNCAIKNCNNKTFEILPTSKNLGPSSPAEKLLPKISITERRISGAELPKNHSDILLFFADTHPAPSASNC